jgi:hypothetical protein
MPFKSDGLLGQYSGKLGDLVFYKRHGKMYVRTKTSNKPKPPSPQQQKKRDAFGLALKAIKAIKPFYSIGFRDASLDEKSAYSAALSTNLNRLHQSGMPGDYRWLLPSFGTRAGAQDISMKQDGNTLEVSWGEPEALGSFNNDDMAVVMALNSTTWQTNVLSSNHRRGHHKASITLPAASVGEHILVFLFFYDTASASHKPNLRHVSEAQWVGSI